MPVRARRLRVGLRHDDDQVGVDAVGDERLRAVEHPAVAVPARGGGMPCRSLPAPGSVIAIAVISSPLAKPRQPALLLLLGGEVEQVRRDDVVVQPEARRRWRRPGSSPRRARRCSGSRATPPPPYSSGDVHAEQPRRAGRPATPRAATMPSFSHSVVEGDDGFSAQARTIARKSSCSAS